MRVNAMCTGGSTLGDLETTFASITGGQTSTEWDASQHTPDYYRSKFHAYAEGNLNWDAALEQLVAGKGVGVRNFPAYGKDGEEHMRSLHEAAMARMGAYVPAGSTIVDLGCGTGTSCSRVGLMCVCVCVCVCARARVHAYVRQSFGT